MDRRKFFRKLLSGLGATTLISAIDCSDDNVKIEKQNSKTDENPGETQNGSDRKDKFNVINVHEHLLGKSVVHKFDKAFETGLISSVIFLGTHAQTLGTSRKNGFTRYDWNNDQILQLSQMYPEKYHALATYPPTDKNALSKFKKFMKAGGSGLKLYNGHSKVYPKFDLPIYCDEVSELLDFCEKNQIPVCYHIALWKFLDQAKILMKRFPKLKINIPHLGVAVSRGRYKKNIGYFLDNYENTYTDVSFGNPEYADKFMRIISHDRKEIREFFIKHRKRIMFGSDMVITKRKSKTEKYVFDTIRSYRDMLEKEKYYNYVTEVKYRRKKKDPGSRCNMYGLNLSDDVLYDIYENNPKRFLSHNFIA